MESPKPLIATFDYRDFSDLAMAKGSTTVSVVIPARNEDQTIEPIVSTVNDLLDHGLVDELVVVDDGSTDNTALVASRAGAHVIESGRASGSGKGRAMRTGLEMSKGDIVVFLDADVTNFGPHFVTGLVGPLFSHDEIGFVKGYYTRPINENAAGGGRVTELTARPIIALRFPTLVEVRQPLAGETAARRELLLDLTFEVGYGVEIGLLIDVAERYGIGAIAQVDLGARSHRNRPLHELTEQAREVLAAALSRSAPSR